jgi:serine phosphatase RsbU (regulator of sigma subunit)
MDIMLCCIEYTDPQNVIMGVSGAKTSMFYVKQGETRINDIRGDNRLIGGMKHKSRPFTRKELYLQVGDMIYLSSDGFGDQNNPEGLKFGKERLRNTFAEISVMSTYEQKKYLETALDYHQQNVEQRDDITVVGIRL